MLGALSNKFHAIKGLIERNRQRKAEKKVKCPFVVVEPTDEPQTELFIKVQQDLSKALLVSNRGMHIFGDLEVISEMQSLQGASQSGVEKPAVSRLRV